MTTDEVVRQLLRARIDDGYRLATHILGDHDAAEDAVQEAAMLAWDRRHSLRDITTADGWFTRILVNVCRDELRRRARQPRVVALDLSLDRSAAPAVADADVAMGLARLTPDEQILLALRYARELTVPVIAGQLGIPEGTVKSRLHAALGHMRAALEAERRAEEAVS